MPDVSDRPGRAVATVNVLVHGCAVSECAGAPRRRPAVSSFGIREAARRSMTGGFAAFTAPTGKGTTSLSVARCRGDDKGERSRGMSVPPAERLWV